MENKKQEINFFGLSINDPKTPRNLLVGVLSLWAITGLSLFWYEGRGTFGDLFGATNALFSGLAFAGIIYSILLQSEELKAQREELQLNREELKETRKEFEQQNKTLKQERFEDTFFRMLSIFIELINAMDVRSKGNTIRQGRDCFKYIYESILVASLDEIRRQRYISENHAPLHTGLTKAQIDGVSISMNTILNAYELTFEQYQGDLSHYFRTLYTILRYIDESSIEDKKKYIRILRAQLSAYELSLLFYNCLSSHGKDNHKPLLERYAILKNVNTNLLIKSYHVLEYDKQAFGKAFDAKNYEPIAKHQIFYENKIYRLDFVSADKKFWHCKDHSRWVPIKEKDVSAV